jgi:hypothetical protein
VLAGTVEHQDVGKSSETLLLVGIWTPFWERGSVLLWYSIQFSFFISNKQLVQVVLALISNSRTSQPRGA